MDVERDLPPNLVNSHHRKIELQSPLDLAYLQSNLANSARQKLDLHFPPSAYTDSQNASAQPATVISLDGVKGPEAVPVEAGATAAENDDEAEKDPLRARVRELVDAFMARTWEAAAKNISVNGMDITLPQPAARQSGSKTTEPKEPEQETEGVDFTYEAYDSRLQAKLAGLYGELETLTAQVSRLRRTAPKEGADAFQGALASDIENDDAEFEAQMAIVRERAAEAAAAAATNTHQNSLGLKPPRDGWHEDIKAMYQRGTNGLAGLAGLGTTNTSDPSSGTLVLHGASLTETVGKVQRARTVAMEFE
jgi:kinetochor protein Mis14/NSL1